MKSKEEVIRIAARSVARAKKYTPNVEFSAMDATRSDVEFLSAVCEAAIQAGATTINIPDTVGYAIPSEFGALIQALRKRIRGMEKVTLSVHCHNDLGLAVANSLVCRSERREAGGVHDQRNWRKGRQYLSRRAGHGPPYPK